MDPTTAAHIPMTAWEQAVIVVLFIFFLGGVFAFVRWVFTWQSKQQDKWQKFTETRDQNWREWMDDQREQDRTILGNIVEAVNELNKKMDCHDGKVEDRINKLTAKRK
ncbi:conserved hypothetical protein [Gammaproteobacteria bacterium]